MHVDEIDHARDGAHEPLPISLGRRAGACCLALFVAPLVGLPLAAGESGSHALGIADAFYRAGALVFGGGHVVLPLLQASVVAPGWVGGQTFLAGYGAAQAVPGPLFTFAAFLGASMKDAPSGWLGGALALAAIFAPSFLLVAGAIPFWERWRTNARMQAALAGVNAAVVGLLLAALYQPVWTGAILAPRDFVAALVAFVALTGIPYAVYFRDTRWLMWLLGPATIAFAVPIYEYRELMKRHWFSLAVGVVVGIAVAICGSLLLSKLLHLSPELQRSLVTRSVSTPFALAVSDRIHAPRDLTALFVIATGICGMLVGEFVLALVPLRSRLARGALFGAAAHAVGTAKAREIGSEEGVVSSLTMMIAGVAMVLIAPLLTLLPI